MGRILVLLRSSRLQCSSQDGYIQYERIAASAAYAPLYAAEVLVRSVFDCEAVSRYIDLVYQHFLLGALMQEETIVV
jgi:hypothetical protein